LPPLGLCRPWRPHHCPPPPQLRLWSLLCSVNQEYLMGPSILASLSVTFSLRGRQSAWPAASLPNSEKRDHSWDTGLSSNVPACLVFRMSRVAVSVVSDYGLDDRSWIPNRVKRFFLQLLRTDRFWGPPSFLYNGYRGVLSPAVKYGRGVIPTTHLLPMPRLRKSRSYTSCLPNPQAPSWRLAGPLYLFTKFSDETLLYYTLLSRIYLEFIYFDFPRLRSRTPGYSHTTWSSSKANSPKMLLWETYSPRWTRIYAICVTSYAAHVAGNELQIHDVGIMW
jgi:hypothetical protein